MVNQYPGLKKGGLQKTFWEFVIRTFYKSYQLDNFDLRGQMSYVEIYPLLTIKAAYQWWCRYLKRLLSYFRQMPIILYG